LKGARLSGLKVHLSRSLPSRNAINLQLAKSSNLLSFLWPEFQLLFPDSQRPIMTAKRVSFKPFSTYHISLSSKDYDKASSAYLGMIKGNMEGSVINIFGPGLSPSAAAKHHEIPREVLATIVYGQVESDAPRRFSLFVKKE
jgi:hypothetical protein